MNNPVVPHAFHALCRLYPSGQKDFVNRSLGLRIRGLHWVAKRRVDANKHSRYYVSPKDACPDMSRCVVPIGKNFEFQSPEHDIPLKKAMSLSELPEYYLFRGDGLMPLRKNDDLVALDDREWLVRQARNNAFMERVRDDWVVLGRRQQTFLKEMDRVAKRLTGELKTGFEQQLATKDRQMETVCKMLTEKEKQIESKDRQLATKDEKFQELLNNYTEVCQKLLERQVVE